MAKLSDFDEIRPYSDGEMKEAFESLLSDRQFKVMLRGFVPWLPWPLLKGLLKLTFIGVKSPLDFQIRYMKHVVRYVLKKSTDGYRYFPSEKNTWDKRYIFLSNHRDIVLDSAILDVALHESGAPTTCEIAIGDNLLIYPWIKTLVRMNKAFVVRRSLTAKEMMRSSILMSQYIHFAINEKMENVWIAQREGRAKDSSDHTQESVLKMLALGYEGSVAESLRHLNIAPLTISYEFDPCDYLKAKEFQQKRDNPSHKKSRQDDLDNMRTGIMGYKGRVVYRTAECINKWLESLPEMPDKELFHAVAEHLDHEIHRNYEIYPNNYIALDRLNGNRDNASRYTPEDESRFDNYLQGQLAKINLPDKDEAFLTERMLTMYANPLRNYLKTLENEMQ